MDNSRKHVFFSVSNCKWQGINAIPPLFLPIYDRPGGLTFIKCTIGNSQPHTMNVHEPLMETGSVIIKIIGPWLIILGEKKEFMISPAIW